MKKSHVVGQLPRPLGDMPGVTVNEEFFVLGGGSGKEFSDLIYRIELDGRSEEAGRLPLAMRAHQAVVIDNDIFVLGGFTGETQRGAYRLNLHEARCDSLSPMPATSAWFSATVLDGKIYVVGGFSIPDGYWSNIAVFDPQRDSWDTFDDAFPPEHFPHSCLGSNAVVSFGGRLYSFGGADEFDGARMRANALAACVAYEPAAKHWRPLGGAIIAREGLVAVSQGNNVYLIGGMTEQPEAPSALIERVDLESEEIETFATLNTARVAPAAGLLAGHIVVTGGVTKPAFEMTADIEIIEL